MAFAEVEKFIDTPVKHYSSGMYVRLAFAVAAHLEPEILIVDEVLAVGDAEFQKKCLGKMGDVARQGRTVVFVSHSMASITALCESALLLSHGEIAFRGGVDATVESYLGSFGTSEVTWERGTDGIGAAPTEFNIQSLSFSDPMGNARARFRSGEDVEVHVGFRAATMPQSLLCVVMVRTSTGVPVFHISQSFVADELPTNGEFELSCRIKHCSLYPGKYVVSAWVGRNAHQALDEVPDALTLTIDQATPGVDYDLTWRHGLLHCDSDWNIMEALCTARS